MKKKNSMKLTIIVFVCLMCVPITNAYLTNMTSKDTCNLNEKIRPSISSAQYQQIIIEDITDGLGLKIYIKNIGNEAVENIVLNTEIIEGPYLFFLRDNITVPSLPPGETKVMHIGPIGLAFGLVNSFPMITFTLHAEDRIHHQLGIITRVIGPFIDIVGDYFNTPFSSEGFTLFSPEYSKKTYLIENSGSIVHEWEGDHIQGLGVYFLENGNLIRMNLVGFNPTFLGGGISGRIDIYDWNSTHLWGFEYANDTVCLHHDFEVIPNGNILMISWEYKSRQEAIAAERNPALLGDNQLWPDHIIEVKPVGSDQGEIVWEWHAWDHLIQDYEPTKENYGDVAAHPELIDINYVPGEPSQGNADWPHINSVDYHEEFDQILLSVHNFNEIWIIDHSTTTEEAAGHTGGRYGPGGDLLYRWGNPRTYRAGNRKDQKFFGQHDAQWIDKGYLGQDHFLVFNNGWGRGFSSVDEIVPPVNKNGFYHHNPGSSFAPKEQLWTFRASNPKDFFAGHISGCQRLPNSNTLICDGPGGLFFEVTMDKHMVWRYTNQFPDLFDNHVFKIRRYSSGYPGLNNIDYDEIG